MVLTLLFLVCFALCGGCGFAPERQARREFMAEHPEAVIREVFVGEGDDQNAHVHIRFSERTSGQAREVMWLYQRQDGPWKAVRKVGPLSPGSDFGD